MTSLQHHLLALGLTTAFSLGLGIFVWLKNPGRRLNQLFALHSLALAGWSATEPWSTILASSRDFGMFWLRIEHVAVFLLPPLVFHLVSALLELRTTQRFIQLGYCLSACFIAGVFSPLVLWKQVPKAYVPLWLVPGPLYHVAVVFFWVYIGSSLWYLWRGYHEASGVRRVQIKYFFWASLLGYLGGGSDFLLVYDVYVPWLNPYALYLVPVYKLMTAYAIVHHRFLDIHVLIRKSLVYSLLVSAVTVFYFGSAVVIERLFQQKLGYHSLGLTLAAFAAITVLFQPFKIAIQRVVDHLILRAPRHSVVKRLEVLEEQAREGERYKAVARLAAGIAHELKNPLTSIKTFVEFFPERHGDPAFREQFQTTIGSAVERLEQITHGLLDFSTPQALQTQPVDVKAVLDDILALTHHELQKKSLTVTMAYTHNGAFVQGDASKLRQAFLNLILNAKEAMAAGGTLTIFTGAVNGHLEVHIADTGCGIHPKDLPHLFEPFFSKKANGHGLGLSIVHSIIREHHGAITVHSTPGRGTTFTIRLPL